MEHSMNQQYCSNAATLLQYCWNVHIREYARIAEIYFKAILHNIQNVGRKSNATVNQKLWYY